MSTTVATRSKRHSSNNSTQKNTTALLFRNPRFIHRARKQSASLDTILSSQTHPAQELQHTSQRRSTHSTGLWWARLVTLSLSSSSMEANSSRFTIATTPLDQSPTIRKALYYKPRRLFMLQKEVSKSS